MTYLYETVPARDGEKPKMFEMKQGVNDEPLTRHPETGEPVRRVILGGWGVIPNKTGKGDESKGCCGCGPSGCC